MNGFKNLFKSKTVFTSAVGVVLAALSAFGVVTVSPEVQASIAAGLFALAGLFRFTATEQLVVN